MHPIRPARFAACALAVGLAVVAGPAAASPVVANRAAARPDRATFTFTTLNNGADPTFNELLGINNHGKIAGYYGSGAKFHPNRGYLLLPPAGYHAQVFPGSAQTQVTGLNDFGVSVGFLSYTNDANPNNNANYGFWARNGHYHKVVFPTTNRHTPQVNRLLGVNNHGVAVGFYLDAAGDAHGYLYSISAHRFTMLSVPGAVSVFAAGINGHGGVAGYFVTGGGATHGFFRRPTGAIVILAKRGASITQAFGVNNLGEVVGTYTVGSATFGFTWTARTRFRAVSDPNGLGSTFVNGVNNAGDLVGFYVGGGGDTNGMLAVP